MYHWTLHITYNSITYLGGLASEMCWYNVRSWRSGTMLEAASNSQLKLHYDYVWDVLTYIPYAKCWYKLGSWDLWSLGLMAETLEVSWPVRLWRSYPFSLGLSFTRHQSAGTTAYFRSSSSMTPRACQAPSTLQTTHLHTNRFLHKLIHIKGNYKITMFGLCTYKSY